MRKPYYDRSRKRWRLQINQPDGPPKKVTLGRDKATAFKVWEQMQKGDSVPGTTNGSNLCERCRRSIKPLKGPKPGPLPRLQSPDDQDAGDLEEFLLPNAQLGNRYRATERILLIVELLTPLRNGATLLQLHQDVVAEYGQVSERTIHRDLIFLASCGLCERRRSHYRWCGFGTKAKAAAEMAEAFSEQRLLA